MVAVPKIVAVKIGRTIVGSDEKVEIAVAIDIGVGRTAGDDRRANSSPTAAEALSNLPFPRLWNSRGAWLYWTLGWTRPISSSIAFVL
jgi:hypothetical protein